MAKYEMSPPGFEFVWKDCKDNCGCGFDVVKILVEGYKVLLAPKWDACLRAKWTIGDCVVGCHNSQYSVKDPIHRNSHQFCLSRKTIIDLIKLFESKELPRKLKNFEDFYQWVNDIINCQIKAYRENKVKVDMGALLKYDVALRMSYNFKAPDGNIYAPDKNPFLPKRLVYLQCGALEGANALLKITELSREEASMRSKKGKSVLI